ncbi:ion transporter [Crocinitomix catalasitica]|nr:ion transporter [Crocinitomix catalasitica]
MSWYFDLFITLLIALNVLAIVLESVKEINEEYSQFFAYFEIFSVVIFTIEYFLRIWSAVEIPKYSHPILGRLRYLITPLVVIDLLAILPFYLIMMNFDLRFMRILRLFRLFKLFRIARYVAGLDMMKDVVREKKAQLWISLVLVFFLLLLASSLMYYVENEAQPESFSSIPETMWWGVSTLTTVGYGDMYPITPLGQFFGGIISIIGIALFALPTGILASGFSSHIEKIKGSKEKNTSCPHCGESLK